MDTATTIPISRWPWLSGCGQKDGLIAPIKGKDIILWCARCGTLIDTEESLDALVPQLLVHSLSALGYQVKTTQQAADEAAQKPAADAAQPAAADAAPEN